MNALPICRWYTLAHAHAPTYTYTHLHKCYRCSNMHSKLTHTQHTHTHKHTTALRYVESATVEDKLVHAITRALEKYITSGVRLDGLKEIYNPLSNAIDGLKRLAPYISGETIEDMAYRLVSSIVNLYMCCTVTVCKLLSLHF